MFENMPIKLSLDHLHLLMPSDVHLINNIIVIIIIIIWKTIYFVYSVTQTWDKQVCKVNVKKQLENIYNRTGKCLNKLIDKISIVVKSVVKNTPFISYENIYKFGRCVLFSVFTHVF